MKIIINQDGVKRELRDGAFELCADESGWRALRDALAQVESEGWRYGWVTVFEKPVVEVTPNTKPIPWTSGKLVGEPSEFLQNGTKVTGNL